MPTMPPGASSPPDSDERLRAALGALDDARRAVDAARREVAELRRAPGTPPRPEPWCGYSPPFD